MLVDLIDVDTAHWLTSAHGDRTLRQVVAELDAATTTFKIAEQLAKDPTVSTQRRTAVLQVAQARRKARTRFPTAEQMLFTTEALQQLSDAHVAAWRAKDLWRRFTTTHGDVPQRVIDLCAGVGGDAQHLGNLGVALTCIEHDPARAIFLRHNLQVLGVPATIVVTDALTWQSTPSDAVFSDPARRAAGKRIHALASYRPSVPMLLERHAQAGVVAVAVAPGIDANDPALPPNTRATYCDVAGQLTEAVLWGGQAQGGKTGTSHAVILPEDLELWFDDAPTPVRVNRELGGWLITVRASAIRARVHDGIAAQIGANRVANHRALFHSAHQPAASAWYVSRQIMAVVPARKMDVRRALTQLEPRPVELVLHGVDDDVTRLWQQLGSPQRGPNGWRIEYIRRDDDTVVAITDGQS